MTDKIENKNQNYPDFKNFKGSLVLKAMIFKQRKK